jgi:hypothetical protein
MAVFQHRWRNRHRLYVSGDHMRILYPIYAFLAKHLPKPDISKCNHAWVVYATAAHPVCLELYCKRCAVFGAVLDPTAEEWRRALGAPSAPYSWVDASRVQVGKRMFD